MTMFKLFSGLLITALCCCPFSGLTAEEGADKAAHKEEAHDAMAAGTNGVSVGEIVSNKKGTVILKTKDGNLLFMAHWRGGNPKDGGGLDKEMLAQLESFKPGQQVKIGWQWQERRRIERIAAL